MDERSLLVLDANAAACALYGYTPEEMIGKSANELRPTEEIERFQKFIAANALRGDVGTWTHRRKDGTTFLVNIRYHSITYNGHAARFVIVIPVA